MPGIDQRCGVGQAADESGSRHVTVRINPRVGPPEVGEWRQLARDCLLV